MNLDEKQRRKDLVIKKMNEKKTNKLKPSKEQIGVIDRANELSNKYGYSRKYCETVVKDHKNDYESIEAFFINKKKIQSLKPKKNINPKQSNLSYIKNELHQMGDGFNVYISPNIPVKNLKNAVQSYVNINRANDIFAIIDSTSLNNGKDGIVFSNKHIYIKEVLSKSVKIAYMDIKSVELQDNKLIIRIKNQSDQKISSNLFNLSNLKNVINAIKDLELHVIPTNKVDIKNNYMDKMRKSTERSKSFVLNAVEATALKGVKKLIPEPTHYEVGDHLYVQRSVYTHHGLYIGNGRVIHYLQHGIQYDNLETFAKKEKVFIVPPLVSPTKYAKEDIVLRAKARTGEDLYSVFGNNCEHYIRWCRNGETIELLKDLNSSKRKR